MIIAVRKFLSVFFVFAFLMAGISPACAFISGKNTIEICSSDGTLKLVEIEDDQTDGKTPRSAKKNDCAFCFTNANIAKVTTDSSVVNLKSPREFTYINGKYFVFTPIVENYFQSRAPPTSI